MFSDDAKFVMEPSAWKKAPMLIDNYKDKKGGFGHNRG